MTDKEARDQERDQQYSEAWEEAEKLDNPTAAEATIGEQEPEEVKEEPATEAAPAVEPTSEPEKKDETYGDVESMRKAVKDTKAWATKLSQENSALRADHEALKEKLEAYERGETSRREVDQAREKVSVTQDRLDEIKAQISEEFPELTEFFDTVINESKLTRKEREALEAERAQIQKDRERTEAVKKFEAEVKPVILEEVPDFDSIVRSDEYWAWLNKQSAAIRFAGSESPDPQDMILAAQEFKKANGGSVPGSKAQETRNRKVDASRSLRAGAAPLAPSRGAVKEDDYEGGWDEAGELLKKEMSGQI